MNNQSTSTTNVLIGSLVYALAMLCERCISKHKALAKGTALSNAENIYFTVFWRTENGSSAGGF